jgi:hypothetical protein
VHLYRILLASGAALLAAGLVVGGAGVASASFSGGSNGDIAWAAICNGNFGQEAYSAPNTATNETCPYPSPNPVTAGPGDSMPYFSSDGAKVYFSSNRNGTNAIYSIPYPTPFTSSVTANGSPPPPQLDNATQLTNPSNTGPADYAPTVSAGSTLLDFIRCQTTSQCNVYTMPLPAGVPTLVNTAVAVAPPNNVNGVGDGNRPEINPTNSDQILYVGTDNHIHAKSLSGALSFGAGTSFDYDLSLNSGVGAAADEHPDWAPDGQAIVFDSSRSSGLANQSGNTVFTMTNLTAASPTVAPVWRSLPAGGYQQLEPFYAPVPGNDVTPPAPGKPPLIVWVSARSGSNIQIDEGNSVNTPVLVTSTFTNNGEPTWQPLPTGAIVPEAPLAVGLPLSAGAVAVGAGLMLRRRNRRKAVA